MENIIIGFSRPKKWKIFAAIIMKVYNTDYDHVYIKFYSESLNRNIIYQASKNMINFMGTEVFDSENIVVKEFNISVTLENKNKLMQFAVDNAGKPYSIKEVIGFAIVKLTSFFGKSITNPFKEGTNEYVCSVLASYVLDNYTDKATSINYQDVDPKFLYDYLNKIG